MTCKSLQGIRAVDGTLLAGPPVRSYARALSETRDPVGSLHQHLHSCGKVNGIVIRIKYI